MATEYYRKDIDFLIDDLDTDFGQGLSSQTVEERKEKFGENKIREEKGVSAWKGFFN